MKHFSLLLSLLLAGSFSLPAQNAAEDQDRITFADGSQANVLLRRTNDLEQSQRVEFRRTAGADPESMTPFSVREFYHGRSKTLYRSVSVDIIDRSRGGARVAKDRFGEVLVDGPVELIKVYLGPDEYDNQAIGSENYLYLLREGEVELTLELTSILVYEMLHANPSRFRNKLKFFTRDCPVALEKARDARFNDVEIMEVVKAYGQCNGLAGMQMDEKRIRGVVTFHHNVRLAYLDIRDKNYDEEQLSGALGYQLEARFSKRLRWLGVLTSVDYVYHTFRWEERSTVAQSMLKGNLSVAVHPLQGEKLELQLSAGLSNYNAISSSFNSFFSNNYFLLDAGVRLKTGNFLFGLNYEYMPKQITRQPGNILLTSFGYRVNF
ncbi:hypothetical protein QWY85_01095 [Neolewinella lacunae]|uniref:DUF481 domain-containing protein n=1 Tax=Neolewinella lacunae TaxID=1517758 RepID=A0A923PPG2_9BACT|nr:hypothetical protein [Neolewinella lacunae]MBC6994998.1 hypothetical protein [Neolewinella lacunae]MDN3633231.1 hypothetical protein [Neolewinella lacunae]